MRSFDGFFLPQLDQKDLIQWDFLDASELRVRYPVLTPEQVQEVWGKLVRRREQTLLHTPVSEIVGAIDATVRRLRTSPADAIELVSAATGYSRPVVAETLTHMLDDWSATSLETMLAAELGDPRVLDHAVPDGRVPGRQLAAFGYARALHIFSGNVPGVAVTSLVRSLLVKSATFGKLASGEPVLPVLFARTLADVAPGLAQSLALCYWPRTALQTQDIALGASDAVVVYGGAEAVADVRAATPAATRLVVHGPRLSFGIVGPESTGRTAAGAARAVAAYDQQGCVSPHLVYVVGDRAKAEEFARDVADQLRLTAAKLPRGTLTPEEAVAIRNARTAAEFSGTAQLFGEEGSGYTVILEEAPEFRVSCLNRVLYVKPVATTQEIAPVLPGSGLLQSAAVEGFPENEKAELVRMLGLHGVSRVTSFERLPWPPMHWHHDGSAPIRELVWWQDIEN